MNQRIGMDKFHCCRSKINTVQVGSRQFTRRKRKQRPHPFAAAADALADVVADLSHLSRIRFQPEPGLYLAVLRHSMTAGADGGPQIEFRADSINLAGSDDAMALAGKIATQLGALMTALNGWDGLSAASLKLVITALHTAGWPASVASSKVKASGT